MRGGWPEFGLAFAAFLLAHALPARPPVRRALVARLGERAYLALYVLASLALLWWLVTAAGRAPYVEFWPWAPWQNWAPLLAMPTACFLVAFGVGAPNPFSFGGSRVGFDPAQPGIAAVARHPLLLAIALWAASHVVPNGDLAHALLFGGFAALALLGMRALDRRRRREWGEAWETLAAPTAGVASLQGLPHALAAVRASPARLAAAALLYLALLALHRPVIGAPPWP